VTAALSREWAGRVAVGEGPEAGLLGEPIRAGAIHRDSGNRQRSKAEAVPSAAAGIDYSPSRRPAGRAENNSCAKPDSFPARHN
jgi:hypothetical protein